MYELKLKKLFKLTKIENPWEAAKKSSSLNGRAIKVLPPPPSGLMAIGTFFFSLSIAGTDFFLPQIFGLK